MKTILRFCAVCRKMRPKAGRHADAARFICADCDE